MLCARAVLCCLAVLAAGIELGTTQQEHARSNGEVNAEDLAGKPTQIEENLLGAKLNQSDTESETEVAALELSGHSAGAGTPQQDASGKDERATESGTELPQETVSGKDEQAAQTSTELPPVTSGKNEHPAPESGTEPPSTVSGKGARAVESGTQPPPEPPGTVSGKGARAVESGTQPPPEPPGTVLGKGARAVESGTQPPPEPPGTVSGKGARAAENKTSESITAPSAKTNASGMSVLMPIAPALPSPEPAPAPGNDTETCPEDSSLPCVSKCCPYGQTLTPAGCVDSKTRFIPQFTILIAGDADTTLPPNETEVRQTYNLIANNICPDNRYRLEPWDQALDEFHLLYNGSLWMPQRKPHILASDEYCMEVFVVVDQEKMLPLVCFVEADPREASYHFIVYPVGLLISVPFLLATFLVYALIPELHTLPGKALACYVFCLMTAYIFLAVVQLGGSELQDEVCISVAFVIQFAFIASFFWLNVLCLDTWRNVFFHGDMSHRLQPAKERFYFVCYSLYAWSCTAVFIIVTMVMKFTPTIPNSYLKPSFGVKTCWFGTQVEAVPYFYAPIGCLILLNVALFIATAIKICHQDRSTTNLGRTPKQTLRLCFTLFFMMGINWVMELISWAAGGANFIWYITDICNTLQGIFIFVIFVMNSDVQTLVRTRLLPRLRCLVPCCKDRFQPPDTQEVETTINGRENTYKFHTMNDDGREKTYKFNTKNDDNFA